MNYINNLPNDILKQIDSFIPLQINDKDLRKAIVEKIFEFYEKKLNGEIKDFYYLQLMLYLETFIRKITINRLENKNYYIKKLKLRIKIKKMENFTCDKFDRLYPLKYSLDIYENKRLMIRSIYNNTLAIINNMYPFKVYAYKII